MTGITQNRLSASASPYLLQHKDNPVHWQPWDDLALAEARKQDRPILLSIGYAACHWCHVMAHESFEDTDIAALMNSLYVNIKVDREERPDIDQLYMAALSAMGEQGGWPLTMILTPEGKPFWGGTYFPKEARYGRPGFADVLVKVETAWRQRRHEIDANADRLQAHLKQELAGSASPVTISPKIISDFSAKVTAIYDPASGGITGAPKFPNAPFLETLWRTRAREQDKAARDRFLETVTAIALGGIYDHIGGGLARYSVDGQWLVPHFEKMLYDNAHFIRHCVWAYAETQSDLFRLRIKETIGWLQRDMTMPAGGFAASLDADSEGIEGKYYVWSWEEVKDILGDDAAPFSAAYDISSGGNWESSSILNLSAFRADPDRAGAEIIRFANERALLLKRRQTRIPPALDGKVLADWNGYAIRAIAEAARYFGSESWLELADQQFRILMHSMFGEDRLSHVHDGKNAASFGFATDYAAMINAALALYEASGQHEHLTQAENLAKTLEKNHFDYESSRGFWMQEQGRSDTPMQTWNDLDEANPSATSQIIEAFTRLALLTDDSELTEFVNRITTQAAGRILQSRFGQGGFINAADTVLAAKKLVVVGSDRSSDPLWAWATAHPDPRRIDVFLASGNGNPQFTREGAYLCAQMKCSPPVVTSDELEILMEEGI